QFSLRLDQPREVTIPPADLVDTPLLSHALIAAPTVNIAMNRFSERVKSVFLSLLANADLMNVTALNQSTHRILTQMTRLNHTPNPSDDPTPVEGPLPAPSVADPVCYDRFQNQILFVPTQPLGNRGTPVFESLTTALRNF